MTYYGTGCIFHYDDEHPIGGKGFTEDDKPNFTGSYYSHTKVGHSHNSFCRVPILERPLKEPWALLLAHEIASSIRQPIVHSAAHRVHTKCVDHT